MSQYSELAAVVERRIVELGDAKRLGEALAAAAEAEQILVEATAARDAKYAEYESLTASVTALHEEMRGLPALRDQAVLAMQNEVQREKDRLDAEYEQFRVDLNVQAQTMRGEYETEKARLEGEAVELRAEVQVLGEQKAQLEADIAALKARVASA